MRVESEGTIIGALFIVRRFVDGHPLTSSSIATHWLFWLSIIRYSTVFTLPVGRLLSYFNLVPHGHVLDVPNAVLGAAYYSYILLLSPFLPGVVTRAAVCGAFASSLFLAYQLTFVIVELCVLCWSTHFINTILMYQLVWSSPSPASSATSSKTKPA